MGLEKGDERRSTGANQTKEKYKAGLRTLGGGGDLTGEERGSLKDFHLTRSSNQRKRTKITWDEEGRRKKKKATEICSQQSRGKEIFYLNSSA